MEPEEVINLLMTNTLGESILVETLRSAAYYVTRSNQGFQTNRPYTKSLLQESRYCYYFVQGTGLDVLIQRFHLEYDPDTIRNTFNYCLRHS